LTEYDEIRKTVDWNWSEVYTLSYRSIVRDMVNFGVHDYARDLADAIEEARIAENVSSHFIYSIYSYILCIVS
jgi:hypothetical protein